MKVPSFSGMTSTQLHLGQFFVLFLDGFLFLFASFCLTDLCCFNNFLDKYLDSLARPLVFFATHQEGWWSLHIYFSQIPPHYSALLPHTLTCREQQKKEMARYKSSTKTRNCQNDFRSILSAGLHLCTEARNQPGVFPYGFIGTRGWSMPKCVVIK